MALGGIYGAAIPVVGGILGGLFSGNAPNLPYTGSITGNLNAESNAGTDLTGLGAQQTGQFNAFAPTATNAVNQDLSLLNQNPYTSTFDAMQLANATKGNQAAFQAAGTQANSNLVARGLGGDGTVGGGVGSTAAGDQAAIAASQATAMGGAANNIAMNAIQQRYANIAQAANVAQGYAQQLYGQGVGATQAGGQLDNSAANGFMNLGQLQQGVNTQYQQQQQQFGSGIGSVLGGGVLSPKLPGTSGLSSLATQASPSILGVSPFAANTPVGIGMGSSAPNPFAIPNYNPNLGADQLGTSSSYGSNPFASQTY